jgi:hypothetical protein
MFDVDFTPSSLGRSCVSMGNLNQVNTLWSVIDGARLGFEWIYGIRNNMSKEDGSASRFNFLVIIDFR